MKRTRHIIRFLTRFPLLTGFLLPLMLTGQESLPDASNPAASSRSAGAERTLRVHAVPTGKTLHPFWSVANFTFNNRRTFSKREDGMLLRNRSPFAREVVVDYILGGRIPEGEEYYHGLDEEGGLMVDFTKLIRRVRHAVEAGYRPWIGLENVPPAMSDPVRWNTYGNSAPPADYDLFERYVRLAMQALVEAFGEETVANWSFIIATEPDLYPGHWSGSKEEFYTLLDHTLRPALQVVPGISISPGNILNPGYARREKSAANPDGLVRSRDHWGLDIIDYMASGDINTGGRNGSRMDFFSFSWYGRIGREMDTFDRAVSVTRERLSRYPQYADIPLDVREFAVLHDEEGRRFYAGDATEWAASFYAALARRVYEKGVRFVFEWDHATLGVLHPRGQVIRFLERMEDKNGEAVLSRDKARREEAWIELEKAFNDTQRVTGTIFGRVKGGFTVDLGGAVAFLPGSQVDIRPVRDVTPLLNKDEPFGYRHPANLGGDFDWIHSESPGNGVRALFYHAVAPLPASHDRVDLSAPTVAG